MKNYFCDIVLPSRTMPLVMAIISAASLGMAFVAQYGFGLEPCILCIIQRYPYAIVIALGLIGFWLSHTNLKATALIMGLIALAFLINSAIAFYHTGVELHWWKSFLEGCAVPDLGSDPDNIIAMLEQSKAARCDEIPWADPIFGLSMANYNVIFCFLLAITSAFSAKSIWKRA